MSASAAAADNSARGPTRVALIGAGFIAAVHLEVLARRRDVVVVALCDPATARAEALARRFGVGQVFGSVAELIRSESVDAVHVLVPPDWHCDVAKQCLQAGLHALVEKPLALEPGQADELGALAADRNLVLGVNHNMTWTPAFRQLKRAVESGRLGRLEHVGILHNVPLRQLGTGDVSHFMFQSEGNILFEQGVHLFSLAASLAGDEGHIRDVRATCGRGVTLANGARFLDSWSVLGTFDDGASLQVSMGFGRGYPLVELVAVGSDGTARVDLIRDTYAEQRRTRWLEFWELGTNGLAAARRSLFQGIGAVFAWVFALAKLRGPSEPFLASMAGSLGDFHAAVRARRVPECSARQAALVTDVCHRAAESAGASFERRAAPRLAAAGDARAGEIVVTGGTGFVGRRLVPKLLEAGHPVTLVVRRPQSLPDVLLDERIRYVVGDATDVEVMTGAVRGARVCVHMATCAGDDPAAIEATMTAGIEAVGRACLAGGVERLVFTSSTAALYLGGSARLPGAVGPDPKPAARPAYARGKIAAEHALRKLVDDGLRAVVLRPAIVVGTGGIPEHSGVGLWVKDNHCVGWGSGSLPLPFVLVDDVADAIVASLDAPGIDGRSYNLAGDVRLTAVDYVARLASATGRRHVFHPTPLAVTWTVELAKWLVKRVVGRKGVFQTMRDLRSRAFCAQLDCEDAKRDLSWQPEAVPERFVAAAIDVHAPTRTKPRGEDAAQPASAPA